MNTYEAYKNKEFNLAAFGIERSENHCDYFCTPVGAEIIGYPGVDGIHYCMVEGFGEMVFAISPMNGLGEYVHPVAKSFDDFLRLLLVCDDNAAIEQCWQWSQEQFDAFLGELEISIETKKAAMHLMELTGLEPMEQPYTYIRSLQQSFDYKQIPFSEEYYEIVPQEEWPEACEEIACEQPATPWAVYYEGNFWTEEHEDDPCYENHLKKHFRWAGRDWYIPSVYTCEKGMVADILMRVDTADIRAFIDKWSVTPENEHKFTREQRRQMEQENPLIFHFNSALNINGTELQNKRGCSMALIPYILEYDIEEQRAILDYYNLNPADGWVIQRSSYPWTSEQVTEITTLEITMTHQPMFLPGKTFEVKAPGEVHTFTNPVTGLQHTLAVQDFEHQEIGFDHPSMQHMEFPKHHIAMSFTLKPDLSQTQFSVTDSTESDSPRVRPDGMGEAHPSGAASIGIIGGADGPTTIIYGTPKNKEQLHAACSGFRFEPMDTVTWQVSFRENQVENMTIELI